jgi:hypothetical protein
MAARARGATLTFGDRAENHRGMQILGDAAPDGFTVAELREAAARFEAAGARSELIDLAPLAGRAGVPEAAVLVVRGGVEALLGGAADGRPADGRPAAERLAAEHWALAHDTRALMYGRVVNKKARHNLCFAEAGQEPDYAAGLGRVVAFTDVPETEAVRAALPAFFGAKAAGLLGEGNYYYDLAKCGIGYHGDSERRRVVGVRLGEGGFPLVFRWHLRGERIGEPARLDLGAGDVYAMSDAAVGWNWKRSATPTLRHAAGCAKFIA